MTDRVAVVFNASAGNKRLAINRLDGAGVGELLARHGVEADVFTSNSEEEAKQYIDRALRDGARTLVVAGGDGTIGMVATELLGTDVALGILPMGTVMNIPRMLGLPTDLEAAADIIGAGASRLIDVGEANGMTFYETASVGMNATIFRQVDRIQEGKYGGFFTAMVNAFRYRPARMTIELDGGQQVHSRALMVTVGNGPYMGLGMTVAPNARLDDGLFDVQIFRHFSKLELIRHLGSIAFGRRRYSPHVRRERSAWVRIEGARPLPIRADSNALGATPLECRVKPAALRVMVAPSADDEKPQQKSGRE